MRYINHKSDFQVIINIKDKEGNIIAPPSVPWEAVFADENGVEFKCYFDGTNYTHCIVDGNDIVCFVDNPGFSCGKLRCTFCQHVPSAEYCDGVMDLSQPLQCDIMLSKRESYDSTPITIDASPNWVKGEQGVQGIQGEKGADGFSPIVSLNKQGSISTLSITDSQGEHTTEIADGAKGDAGFSPVVSLTKAGVVSTLTITDESGEHTTEILDGVTPDAYTKAESDAMLATKQNVLTAGDGIVIDGDVVSVDEKKFTVWSNPRIDEYVTTFTNFGYNDDGTQKTSGSSVRSWVFRIGNYGHKKVYFTEMNAWMCDGIDDAQNMINPTLLGKSSGNVNIGEEHIGKYIVAMSVSGFGNFLGTDYCRCVMFCDEKTQAELDADERMLSDMYAGNLMRYAVATSAISDTPTLEWGNGAYLSTNCLRNIFLDIVSRPNIAYECKVVKKLDYLYQGCGRLIEITPLWDTSLVTTMRSAFQMCRSLLYADLSHLDMGAVTDVVYLFYFCIALIEVKLPSLPSVTNCASMFSSCSSLQSIVLPELPSVTNCASMFSSCSSLQSVTLPELPLVTSCVSMFDSCSSLQSVTLPELPSVTSCVSMFRSCSSLQSIVLPELPSVTNCASMFSSCSSLQSVTLPELPLVTSCVSMFDSCSSLQSVTLPELPSVTSCVSMFRSCSSLQSITLPSLPSVTNCKIMFYKCSSLQSLYLDMPNCENFAYSFYGCNELHTIEIVDVRKATELVYSFYFCSSLQNVTCVEELPKCAISFSSANKLTLESVTNIITHLPDLSAEDSKTLTLHATTKSLLTESLIAEATNKNWIIS